MVDKSFDRRRLREARIKAGLTQLQLASRVHVTETTVYQWEHDLRTPRPTRVPAIAAALGIAPEELMIDSADRPLTLADVRQRVGYSQAALAARLALPPSTLSSIEQGRHRPGASADRWRRMLGLSAAEFNRLWQYNHDLFLARKAAEDPDQ